MLNLDWNIIWTFVNILVLFLFFKKFLFKPVNEMIEKRKQVIIDSLNEADHKKAEAYKLKNDFEEEIKHANEHAMMILKEARERAEIEYHKIVDEARDEAAKVIAEAKQTIELERKKSLETAQSEIASIAILAAAKVIGNSVNDNINHQYLGDFIREVGAQE